MSVFAGQASVAGRVPALFRVAGSLASAPCPGARASGVVLAAPLPAPRTLLPLHDRVLWPLAALADLARTHRRADDGGGAGGAPEAARVVLFCLDDCKCVCAAFRVPGACTDLSNCL